jgi:ABC-type proline/glycine betaine transport system ATPase subunit
VLLVTHDLREAFRLADRVAILDRGRVRQVGRPREILDAPADDFVRDFVSDELPALTPDPSPGGRGEKDDVT